MMACLKDSEKFELLIVYLSGDVWEYLFHFYIPKRVSQTKI